MKQRLQGLLALIAGAAATYWECYLPLQAAKSGAPEIRYGMKVVMMIPLLLAMGCILLVLGKWTPKVLGKPDSPNALMITLSILLAVAGIAWFYLLEAKIKSFGYH